MNITIRPACKKDIEQAIPLMFSSGPNSFRYVFSVNDKDEALDFLKFAFAKGHGEFGYNNHYVACIDGEVVGLLGYRRAKDSLAYTFSAIRNIISYYGWRDGVKVIAHGLRFEALVKPPKAGRPCIHNLGVAESTRGKGVGAQLIAFAEEKAKQQGKKIVCLDVAEYNTLAKKLYERLGFIEIKYNQGALESNYGKVGSSFYMEKQL